MFEGCLQYIYGENIGTISSFNLKDVNSQHLSNQVCQKKEELMILFKLICAALLHLLAEREVQVLPVFLRRSVWAE